MKPGDEGAPPFAAPVEQDKELLLEFVLEGEEQLDGAEAALLGLEKRPKRMQEIDAALRSLHSLKGAAGYVSMFDVQELCHASEDLLGARSSLGLTEGERIDLAFEAITLMRQRLSEVRDFCNAGRAMAPNERVRAFLRRVGASTS
jgi:two-component system chemotaxis sensor kinase CheA